MNCSDNATLAIKCNSTTSDFINQDSSIPNSAECCKEYCISNPGKCDTGVRAYCDPTFSYNYSQYAGDGIMHEYLVTPYYDDPFCSCYLSAPNSSVAINKCFNDTCMNDGYLSSNQVATECNVTVCNQAISCMQQAGNSASCNIDMDKYSMICESTTGNVVDNNGGEENDNNQNTNISPSTSSGSSSNSTSFSGSSSDDSAATLKNKKMILFILLFFIFMLLSSIIMSFYYKKLQKSGK